MVTGVDEIRNAHRSPNCVLQADSPDYYFRISQSDRAHDRSSQIKANSSACVREKSLIKMRYMHLKENPNMCACMALSLDFLQDMVVVKVPKLGRGAAVKAIREWGQPKSKITHLAFSTTSGVDMPGVDFQFTKGLRPPVESLMMYRQGCFAGGTVLHSH